MTRPHGHTLRWPLATVALALCLATAGGARAQDTSEGAVARSESGGATAFMLAMSGNPLGVVPASPATIRSALSEQIATTLSEHGAVVVPQDRMLAVMRWYRVRDGRSFPREFLDSLTVGLNVRLLVVVDLVVEYDRLTVTARYVDPGSAALLNIATSNRLVAPGKTVDAATWLAQARSLAAAVVDARPSSSHPEGTPLLVLQTQPVGCPAGVALIASNTILRYYVEHGDRPLIDPAVTTATLRENGCSERYIGAEARALLEHAFSGRELVVTGLISYAPAPRRGTQLVEYDDYSRQTAPGLSDFAMSMRKIDLATGTIATGKEVFLPVPNPTGWFGVPREDDLLGRLTTAASQLWTDMKYTREES